MLPGRHRARGWRRAVLLPLAPAVLLGPPAVAQDPLHAYRTAMFACTSWQVAVTSEVTTDHEDTRRLETVGWRGTAVADGRAGPGGTIVLVAWFDSLSLWRDLPEGRLEPSAAGMIGGRYHGTLDSTGTFHRSAAPFIPDQVAAVAGLDRALDELWPPAPPMLAVGLEGESGGWRFERLRDTTTAGAVAWRFRTFRRDSTEVEVAWADGSVGRGHSVEEDAGRLVWQSERGPLLWARDITTVVTFPPSNVARRAVRTVVRQERTLRRGPAIGTCPPS